MRTLCTLTVALSMLLGATRLQADEAPSEPIWSPETIRAALASGEGARVARAAYEAVRRGEREWQPEIVEALAAAAGRPEADRVWALEQALLDALTQFEIPVSAEVLMPHFDAHTSTVVVLLARGGKGAVSGLWTAYDRLDPGVWNEAWHAVGSALDVHDDARFLRRILGEIRIRHQVLVTAPPDPRRNPSSARPPPRYDIFSEEREVPPGYPPLGTWELFHRSGSARQWISRDVRMFGKRTVHEAGPLVLTRTTQDDRSPMDARARWLHARVDARGSQPGAGLMVTHAKHDQQYTGPTPYRRWIGPIRKRAYADWWRTVTVLVEREYLSVEEAAALDAPIRFEVNYYLPGMPGLPPHGLRNPYRKPAATRAYL